MDRVKNGQGQKLTGTKMDRDKNGQEMREVGHQVRKRRAVHYVSCVWCALGYSRGVRLRWKGLGVGMLVAEWLMQKLAYLGSLLNPNYSLTW